jgi:hypothetical protein
MNSTQNIFSRNWYSIVTNAIMDRARRPSEGTETLMVTKSAFDDLVAVAEVASRVQHSFRTSTEMTITYQNGEYQVAVRDKILPPFTVSKPTVLDAISEAQRKIEAEVGKFLR